MISRDVLKESPEESTIVFLEELMETFPEVSKEIKSQKLLDRSKRRKRNSSANFFVNLVVV